MPFACLKASAMRVSFTSDNDVNDVSKIAPTLPGKISRNAMFIKPGKTLFKNGSKMSVRSLIRPRVAVSVKSAYRDEYFLSVMVSFTVKIMGGFSER